jgi:hypothetical protein
LKIIILVICVTSLALKFSVIIRDGYSCKLAFLQFGSRILSKIAKLGWVICLIGTALWFHAYFSIGSPPGTPWWIADLFPNTEADWGVGLMLCGTALAYWPSQRQSMPRLAQVKDPHGEPAPSDETCNGSATRCSGDRANV